MDSRIAPVADTEIQSISAVSADRLAPGLVENPSPCAVGSCRGRRGKSSFSIRPSARGISVRPAPSSRNSQAGPLGHRFCKGLSASSWDPVRRMLDEKLYWFVAKNLPGFFDGMFRSSRRQGITPVTGVAAERLPGNEGPRVPSGRGARAVLATHYGSAQVLGTLREKGFLPVSGSAGSTPTISRVISPGSPSASTGRPGPSRTGKALAVGGCPAAS